MTLLADAFPKLRTLKVAILATARLPYLLITLNVIEFEKVSFSNMQNNKTVFKHIYCRCQVFSD